METKAPKSQFFDFFTLSDFEPLLLPFFSSLVSAGFASPALDYMEEKIDLSEYLVRNKNSTFFARVKGSSMQGSFIFSGDLLVIDRSLQVKSNSICMCILDGDFTLKIVRKERDGSVFLVPSNPTFSEIKVTQGMDFEIWGVVLHVIHTIY